jgi:glycosyltransferase involved in cell wall biosynthesis
MRVAVLWLGEISRDTGGRTYLTELLGPLGSQPGLDVDVHLADAAFLVPQTCRAVQHRMPRRFRSGARILAESIVAARLNGHYDVLLAPFNNLPLTWRGPSVVGQHNVLAFGEHLRKVAPWSRALYRPLALRHSLRRATRTIAVSEYLRRLLLEAFPWADGSRVHVVHCGAPPPAEVSPRAHPSGRPQLLAVSALWPYKRIDQAVRALSEILPDYPEAQLTVAGPAAGEERTRLERLALKYGVAGRVHFLGNVDHRRLVQLYRDSNVLLYLSEIESFGLPVLEAMQLGIPVVARRIEALAEIGGAGPAWVPPDASHDDVAAAIRRVLDDAGFRAARIQAGHEQASRFTWTRTAEETAAVLRAAGGRAGMQPSPRDHPRAAAS